jgi:hypothetical protein|tara:strand:- start:3151 stop:4260 length:1110 start_codon:yes stop_codon:yes gene_type:complete
MSAYKQFNSQDLIVSPFEVNKNFHYTGGLALTESNVEIGRYLGRSGNYLNSSSYLTGNMSAYQLPAVLVYDGIQQLYYSNYISGSGGFVGDTATASIAIGANEEGDRLFGRVEGTNYYNYDQTTLWPSRNFPIPSPTTSSVPIGVISIPSKLWGDYIQPNSFYMKGLSGSIRDDGEGRLLYLSTASGATYDYMSGNIIYDHGIITIFDSHLPGAIPDPGGGGDSDFYGNAIYGTSVYGGDNSNFVDTDTFINSFIDNADLTMSFSSSLTIYETQYKATINENEFNYSLNPSSITGSGIPTVFSGSEILWENTASIGTQLNTLTGSYFSPYITTVGLYDEDFQLLAVGKLAKPLQSSLTTDTTILINIDR